MLFSGAHKNNVHILIMQTLFIVPKIANCADSNVDITS
jgi:hypothetical protein